MKISARAYLLIEVMIGGVIASAVMVGVLSQIGEARARAIVTAREVVATQLVTDKLEQARGLGFAGVAPGTITEAPVLGLGSPYSRETNITAAQETLGAFTLDFKKVEVTVRFNPSGESDPNKLITKQASLRLYP